ncbi:MAG: hypothetical protein II530_01420 [Bacteroidaceae bacterium]|nr:hypothetical protein [Bacteroidaceae bacterium]
MICTKYEKFKRGKECCYMPSWEYYIFDDDYGKEETPLDLVAPEEIKDKKLIPLLIPSGVSYDLLSNEQKSKVTCFFYSFMNRIKGSYPEVISLEIERGKCVKFLFQSFTTVGFLDSPLVCYYAINVLGRRNRLNIKF